MNKPETSAAVFPAPVVARLLNISERHLRRLAADGVVPKTSRGEYPLAGCVQGYVAFLQIGAGVDISDPSKMAPFLRRAHYQAELEKLKIQNLCAELIPHEEVAHELWLMMRLAEECLDGLLELLARECGLSGKSLALVEKRLGILRKDLRDRMRAPGTDEAG